MRLGGAQRVGAAPAAHIGAVAAVGRRHPEAGGHDDAPPVGEQLDVRGPSLPGAGAQRRPATGRPAATPCHSAGGRYAGPVPNGTVNGAGASSPPQLLSAVTTAATRTGGPASWRA